MTRGSRPQFMVEATNLCHYCLERLTPNNETVDHVVPRAIIPRKKKLPLWLLQINRVPACKTCNNRKGSFRADCPCRQCKMAWAAYTASLHLAYMPKIVSIEFITARTESAS